MDNDTSAGTVYLSRAAADRQQTRKHFAALGQAVLVAVTVVVVAWMMTTQLVGWWLW